MFRKIKEIAEIVICLGIVILVPIIFREEFATLIQVTKDYVIPLIREGIVLIRELLATVSA